MSAYYPQADGQTEDINCTIAQILYTYLLNEDQGHWPDYIAVIEMTIDSTINTNIQKAPFEVLYSKNTLLLKGLI